jgi:rSAM/selenodomain-associated transferase 1
VRAVAVLARAPSGGGKSRLTQHLPPDDARALREALLLDTLDQARAAAAPVTLFLTPAPAREEIRALVGDDVRLERQADGDIGDRMAAAFGQLFAGGARHVVLIGSDLPSLPASRLADAFTALEQRDDVVLGPAEDGGYYLVALSAPRPALFTGVAWGTRDVLRQTLEIARAAGLSVALVGPWYDVDTADDLSRVAAGDGASRTRAWLAACGRQPPSAGAESS